MAAHTISILEPTAKRKQFQREGYCVLENIASEAILERTRACVRKAVATQDLEKLARARSPGTLIDSGPYPEFAGIIGNPTALLALAKYVASLRFGVDWGKLDYLSRADELAVPILLFHGDEDDTVPIRTSEALAEARPDIVEYIRTSGAPHVGSWNMNRAVYEAAVSDFIRRVAPRPAETTGIAAP